MNLSKAGKVTRIINAVAAGTDDTTSSAVIDMKGYDSVLFIIGFGAITATAVTTVKAQQGAASNLSDAADLLGSAISVADDDDNQVVVLEISKPRERYVRVQVVRATANAVIDFGIAIQHGAKTEPVTHDSATVVAAEFHHAPAEGTA